RISRSPANPTGDDEIRGMAFPARDPVPLNPQPPTYTRVTGKPDGRDYGLEDKSRSSRFGAGRQVRLSRLDLGQPQGKHRRFARCLAGYFGTALTWRQRPELRGFHSTCRLEDFKTIP